MILDLVLAFFSALFTGLIDALVGLVPPPPPEVITGMDVLSDLYDVVATVETWVPVSLAVTMVGVVLVTYFVAVTIGLARVIVSYLTLGGGAT